MVLFILAYKSSISNSPFHFTRHTFATLTITAGADIFTTSKLLGHTNVHTTEIYADVVMNTMVDAVNLVSGFFC